MIPFDYSSADLKHSKEKMILSSVIGEDNFFYGLFRKQPLRLMASRLITGLTKDTLHTAEKIKALFERNDLLNYPVDEVKMAVASPHFMLVPGPASLPDSIVRDWLDDTAFDPGFTLLRQPFPGLETEFVFSFPEALKTGLSDMFPDVTFLHLNACLAGFTSGQDENRAVLNVFSNTFQLLAFQGGKLLGTHHYPLNSKEDVLYYTLLLYKNNSFRPESVPLCVSGHISEDSPTWKLLLNHLGEVHSLEFGDRLHYSNVFLGKPRRWFYDLDCVRGCG